MEVELKLRVAPNAVARLQRHRIFQPPACAPPLRRRVLSTYFDTPQLELREQRIALRLRRMGGQWYQTVKDGGEAVAGLHQRGEWETRLARNEIDLDVIADPRLKELFASPRLRAALVPVFSTTFYRTARVLDWEGTNRVEFALDRGELHAGCDSEAICEIELELKSGDLASLYDIAMELHKDVELRVENASKAERGYALFKRETPRAWKAATPALNVSMTAEQAFQHIVANCVAQLQANEAGIVQGVDVECVHQARVALRRLRSALPLFAPLIPRACWAAFAEELKWLANALGAARDWDVFCGQILIELHHALPQQPGLPELMHAAEALRNTHRLAAQSALAARRYTQLLLGLGAWLSGQRWRGQLSEANREALALPVGELAADRLAKRHRQMAKDVKRISELDDAQRHTVRINAKRMRYATEFFAALYPGKALRCYADDLADLQDRLGALNDVAVARRLLHELAAESEHPTALGAVVGWNAARVREGLAGLDKAWRNVVKKHKFWVV
ncbi:MAG: CHAD domain-containing protein [Burkholderiales bacterium]